MRYTFTASERPIGSKSCLLPPAVPLGLKTGAQCLRISAPKAPKPTAFGRIPSAG
jgi:hypothetical protein